MSVTYTTHYEFGKQEDYSDLFSMKVITDNWDSLDAILYGFSTGKQDKLSATNKLSVAFVDFTPAQIAALDSGITSEDVEQIETNKNNILSVADQSTKYNLITPSGSGSGHGFTVTDNNDGTFSVNGTRPSGDTSSAWISIGKVTLPSDSYTMHGATGQAQLALSVGGTTYYAAEAPTTFSGAVNDSTLYIHVPAAVQSINNVVVKPIIIKKSLYDAGFTEYQPYVLSNAELTAKEQANENNISLLNQYGGGKNILKPDQSFPQTINGITFTQNKDGTITANGSPTNPSEYTTCTVDSYILLETGKTYVMSGSPEGGGDNNYRTDITRDGNIAIYETGNGTLITGESSMRQFRLVIYPNYSPNNLKFKPMICTIEDWQKSHEYQPHALSNAELTTGISNWESYDCFNTASTKIDSNNSTVTVKVNRLMRRIIIIASIRNSSELTTSDSAVTIGNIGSITGYASLYPPVNNARAYLVTGSYTVELAKNASSDAITWTVRSGSVAANTTTNIILEYTYF
ncbi:MAG: hypothetical protein K6G82_07570 [Ruminococcus sp.]|nr:hypothetical protein [Ruminococcus sp.]